MIQNLKLKFLGPLLIVSLFIFALACEEETVVETTPAEEAPVATMDKEEDNDHEDGEEHHDDEIEYSDM